MSSITNNTESGGSAAITPAGSGAGASLPGEKIEPDQIASGSLQTNRINPCEPVPGAVGTGAGEPTITSPETGTDEPEPAGNDYLRSNGVISRALRLLKTWGFAPARISISPVPVDILAFRKYKPFLIQVIYSRKPVPDAKTLQKDYAGKIQHLRMLGAPEHFRKIVMVYSSKCGWKYYDVLPGGLIPAWDLPEGSDH
jgi:hypothetical protein